MMNKFFYIFMFLSFWITTNRLHGQSAPVISYSGVASTYLTNTPITALTPTNSGGAMNYAQVTTFAGSGAAGSTDGTGTAASFNFPSGVVVDASGNLFVTDLNNNKIRKITSGGVVTTFAGSGSTGSTNGTGTAASFNAPYGISIDASGNLYVTDVYNGAVRKITSAGVVTTFSTGFDIANSAVVDGSGNVYVAEEAGGIIWKFTDAGVGTIFAGSLYNFGYVNGSGSSARFAVPIKGIALDASGNLYVSDVSNNAIRKITPAGVVSLFKSTSTTGGIALDALGNVYAINSNNQINKITPAGVVTTLAGSGSTGSTDGIGTGRQF